ncbi:MAG: F0F1 ATP synthase subunit A [Verrucomicrobia bacterium]|nr:F0F1 ATP synthase subunit A [Verrucomicrobiota bacterium]
MRVILWITILTGMSMNALCAAEAGAAEGHGMPVSPEDLFTVFGLPVTNSMVITWIVALLLIVFARLATRRMELVPSGLQNFWEWFVEGLFNLFEGIMGRKLTLRTFWFLATLFIFILAVNWFGLIPGVATIGWGVETEHGFMVTKPLLRGGNTDLNLTFGMAILFFFWWFVWAIQTNGVKGFFLHIFGPKGEMKGFLRYLMIVVFAAMGFIEVISICFRPIALSFRLFGNIFAGENMLEAMATMVPALGWLIPIPFYFLEILFGLVQAFVFAVLAAVFTLLDCGAEEEEIVEGHS